jgi:hypothetical protein
MNRTIADLTSPQFRQLLKNPRLFSDEGRSSYRGTAMNGPLGMSGTPVGQAARRLYAFN